jgi:hypothetical protein
MKRYHLLSLIFVISCTKEARNSLRAIPNAFGTLNEIVVIADKDVWNGPVGDTLMHYYTQAFPVLPQPEPVFDIRHFTGEQLLADPFRKELRTYLFLGDLSNENSPITQMMLKDLGEENIEKAKYDTSFHSSVGKDKWAKGQLLIYEFAPNREKLLENIIKDYPLIKRRVYEADRNKLDATVYLNGTNENTNSKINANFDITLKLPKDYAIAIMNENVAWLRKETENISSNILISKIPYTETKQLTPVGLKDIRDQLGKEYVSSAIENSYMKINDLDLPLLTTALTVDNKYALEARGIWEMENDYMGGPFITYLVHDPDNNELIFLDGFLYAPGQDKRDHIMALEHIFKSLRF